VVPIAPSTYFRQKVEQRDPTRRAQGDEALRAIIRRIWTEHRQVYESGSKWAAKACTRRAAASAG
jgi:hypothetical protein